MSERARSGANPPVVARRRVALSGASGFIGSVLKTEIANCGFDAVRIDRIDLEHLRAGIDQGALLKGCEAAVHLAARVHVLRETEDAPLSAFRAVNRDTTLAFARACVRAGVRRFVFVSSIHVNGSGSTFPFRPSDPPAPEDPYAISKSEAESGLWEIARATELEVVVVRPPLVYGPNVRGNFLRLLKLAALPIPLPLGSVSGKRSFISVWNLSDLLIRCLDHPNAPGGTFLAGDGEDIELPRLISILRTALRQRPKLLPVPESVLRTCAALIGMKSVFNKLTANLQVDITETRSILEWSPPVSTKEGLIRTAKWYSESRT
jgi:nucleoside-diphosphate-sugar epimerase